MTADEIRAMRFEDYLDTIRAFTDTELIPAEPDMVRRGAVPPALVDRMAELGLFGITLDRSHGGLGWNVAQQVLLTMEFTRASVVYRSRFSTTIGLVAQAIAAHGTPDQRARLLPELANGRLVAAFALTEEYAGTDATAIRTTAVADGDGYVLNGHKRYITNGHWADVLLVFARHRESPGLSAFLVGRTAPGVTQRDERPRRGAGRRDRPGRRTGRPRGAGRGHRGRGL